MAISRQTIHWIIGGVILLLVLGAITSVVVVMLQVRCTGFPKNISWCNAKDEMLFIPDGSPPESGTCYRAGEQPPGVCGKNMAIVPDAHCKRHGVCDCNNIEHNRTLIYHAETDQCYFIYEQGYCPPGEYITITSGKDSKKRKIYLTECSTDICWEMKVSEPEKTWVPFKGSCFELYSNIPNDTSCDQPLRFYKFYKDPTCALPPRLEPINVGSVGSVPSSPCAAGSKQAHNGHCQPVIEFPDFR